MSNEQKAPQAPAEGLPDAEQKAFRAGHYVGTMGRETADQSWPRYAASNPPPVTPGLREAVLRAFQYGMVYGADGLQGPAKLTDKWVEAKLDECCVALSPLGAAPRARTGRECWVLWDKDKPLDARHISIPPKFPADKIWIHMVEAGALPATQGEESKAAKVQAWEAEHEYAPLAAQVEGKEEGPVATLPDASRQEDGK